MAGSLSDYSENKINDHLHGKTSFTMPTTVAFAMATTTITDATTGATIVEPTYTGHARKAVAAADFNASSGGVLTTNTDEVFPACTAGTSTIVGVAVLDSATEGAGNMLTYSDVTSHVIDTGNTPATVPAGGYTSTLT